MRTIVIFLAFLTALSMSLYGQTDTKTYFRLSVLNEGEDLPTTASIFADYSLLSLIPIKGHNGNDEDILLFKKIIDAILADNRSEYVKLSQQSDSTIVNSYEFYRVFVPHSSGVKVYAKVTIGTVRFLYISLDESLPLIAFAIDKSTGVLLNHPEFLEHPAVVTLTDAINKAYLLPQQFQAASLVPKHEKSIQFDSISGNPDLNITMGLDLKKIIFDTKDRNDTANSYEPQYKSILEFYRSTLDDLTQEDLLKYYARLSPESKDRISKSMTLRKNNPKESKKFYSQYKRAYTVVSHILDLGAVKVLFIVNPAAPTDMSRQKVYLLERDGDIKIINEFMEFYMDDVFKTKPFKDALQN